MRLSIRKLNSNLTVYLSPIELTNMMKKVITLMSLALMLGFSHNLVAQGPPPPPGGGQGDPPTIPIDGGLSLLLAAGVAYGGKKVYEMNKKEDEDTEA